MYPRSTLATAAAVESAPQQQQPQQQRIKTPLSSACIPQMFILALLSMGEQ